MTRADSGLYSDEVPGDGEQRTEAVQNHTAKERPQPATQQFVESVSGATGSAGRQAGVAQDAEIDDIEEAILFAKKYLEDLLSFFGLNIDVYATTEDHEVIELDVPSTHLNGFLIGVRGDTLRALQSTISAALKNKGYAHTRVNIDIAGYKQQHAERLAKQAEGWFRDVQKSGQEKELPPMSAADRRTIHKAAEDFGISTESVGFGRDRHVVLKLQDATAAKAKEVE